MTAVPPPQELPDGSPVDQFESALGIVPRREAMPLPRWIAPLAICCVIGMVPWMVYLGLTLPERVRSDHYDIAWLGFDSAMWLVLVALAFFAFRRHPATGPVAAIASAMLLVDGWFDVTTSDSGGIALALLLAVCGELPLAIICGWTAFNAERVRARAYRSLHSRWEHAIDVARAAEARAAAAVLPPVPVSPPAGPQ
jgi:hypothetical protein